MDPVLDPETGLQYDQARYYDPNTAQFLTRDPADALTREAYGYAIGNPTNLTDPTGRGCSALGAAGVAALDTVEEVFSDGTASLALPAEDAAICGAGIAASSLLAAQANENGANGNSGTTGESTAASSSSETTPGCDPETSAAEDTGAAADTVVLGHYPEYLQVGGRTFSVPTDVWDAMSPEEQWAANQKFLDRAIARGSDIQLATPADAAREGSFYERELQYLQSKGYTVGPGGTSMVPPGG